METRERTHRTTLRRDSLPFDRVEIGSGPERRVLAPMDYADLPLSDRVRLMLENAVTFRRGAAKVDTTTAVRALRAVARR